MVGLVEWSSFERSALRSFRKYPYSPTEEIGISRGGGSVRPKNLKLNLNFQRGGQGS